MQAYAGFAGIYDLLMDDYDYPAWADYYMALLGADERPITALCDCACGTGSMTLEFAERIPRVVGVDISQEMLERAAEKARQRGVQARFVCQDMARLALPRPVDALTCACDGVNYLTSDRQLAAFFRAAHAALKPGGALAFDISSAYKLRHVLAGQFYGEERDEAAYLWQNRLDGDILTMDISFYIRQEGGLYCRVTETHHQRAYEPELLVRALTAAGFEDIKVYGDRSFAPPRPEEARLHFSARRQ